VEGLLGLSRGVKSADVLTLKPSGLCTAVIRLDAFHSTFTSFRLFDLMLSLLPVERLLNYAEDGDLERLENEVVYNNLKEEDRP